MIRSSPARAHADRCERFACDDAAASRLVPSALLALCVRQPIARRVARARRRRVHAPARGGGGGAARNGPAPRKGAQRTTLERWTATLERWTATLERWTARGAVEVFAQLLAAC
eukprot:6186168-Pleurochrysis_carterae.AAC.6